MIINNLTTEDIKFLKELKRELNTQNSRMTANPRIYQIRSEKFQTNPNGEGEYFEAVFEGDSLGVFEYTSEGVEEVKAILREITDDENVLKEIDNICLEDLDREWIYFHCYIGDFKSIFNNVFFTEKACRQHIEENKHHYRNPMDYLNFAFRNPEMETLLGILSKIEIKEES